MAGLSGDRGADAGLWRDRGGGAGVRGIGDHGGRRCGRVRGPGGADGAGAGPVPAARRGPAAGRGRAAGVKQALGGLLEEGKRGDPVSELTWSTLSLRDIARQMTRLGFRCGKDAIARLMREDGWSLQGMSRVLEGRQHADRDAQFRHIAATICCCPPRIPGS